MIIGKRKAKAISLIRAIMQKEVIHILRDPRVLGITIIMPLFQLMMFGYALSFDINNIPTGVYDRDQSATSRLLLSKFSSSNYFNIVVSPNENDFAKRIDHGEIKMAIVIPNDFEKNLRSDRKAAVQVLVDGSDPNFARVSVGYSSMIIGKFSASQSLNSLYSKGISISQNTQPIIPQGRVWYNPELKSVNYIVPGLMALIMMTITTISVSVAIVRERERGTFENIMISPVKSWELIVGKIIPYIIIAFLEALLIVITGQLLFGVPLNGSLALLAACIIIYVAGTLGLGLLISAATDSQQVASLAAFIISFLPAFLLSGFVFPIQSMPLLIQFITYIVPARYFLVIIRGVFLKGVGISVLWPQIAALIIFAALVLIIASIRLRRALA